MAEEGVRIDVWLWRARFFKTRAMAAEAVERGVRVRRSGAPISDGPARIHKPAWPVRPGDEIVFARSGRLSAIRIEALGSRRGPPAEARALYSSLENP
ncbi:MAG: RNA-binding S4 domain-containing protein [Caulobacteraceae bacterium]